MIVVPQQDRVLVITQTDHARFAAELLSLWRSDGLPDHPRRSDLLFAVREHDNGWREADAAPRLDPATGLAYDFIGCPQDLRREIWRRGVSRYVGERAWAALLILTHARELHRNRPDSEPWREFREDLDSLEESLLEQCDGGGEQLREDYELLELADHLSLMVCQGTPQSTARRGIEAWIANGELGITPFPFAGTTSFEIPCRWIPARRYANDVDLAVEIASARWTETRIKVVSGSARWS